MTDPDAPMAKTHDYVRHFRGLHRAGAKCRIRIYERAGAIPVVIATELPDNPSSSTNAVEYLAAEVIAQHLPERFEPEKPAVWVEHYPPLEAAGRRGKITDYSVVEFTSWTPRRVSVFGVERVSLGEPVWRPLTGEGMERLLEQPAV